MKIGICDWGIGGLGAYNAVRKMAPNTDVIYFSDAGYTPYGKVPKNKLHDRWIEVKNFFLEQEVAHIIVACNALSTVVNPSDEVTTIAPAVKQLIVDHEKDKLAVIGGERTIESGIYNLGYQNHSGVIAQPLSALVEKGQLSGEEVEQTILAILEPIKEVDFIVLACTHYPVLVSLMNKMYPKITFLDPVDQLIDTVNLSNKGLGKTTFYTSGDLEEMKLSAKDAFGVEITSVTSALDH